MMANTTTNGLDALTEQAKKVTGGQQPLEGLIVLDLSHVYAGPYTTFLLAMAGAKVIKIEQRTGEHLRSRGDNGGASMAFAMLNSNKESITLDLKSEEGKALFLEMAERADVVVENFAPGVTDRLGIGPSKLHEINPGLVYASSTGYGTSGPYRDYPAMDLVVQAMSGVIDITGYPDQPPVKAGPALCDFSGGVHLYGAIMTALFQRSRTGKGDTVEVAMLDCVYPQMASNIGMYHASNGELATRTGNRHGGLGISPYNVYKASDGYVVLNAPGDHHFRAILEVIGREDLKEDPRFLTRRSRVENMFEVDDLLESWTSTQSKYYVAEKMLEKRVPCAPVRNLGEVMKDEHMHARGMLQDVDHPDLGKVTLIHSPLRYESASQVELKPSSPLGRENRQVFVEWLGHSADEFEALVEKGVI